MLARIATNLYWTGRYLERSEHLARYLRVQYFSMLDAPMSQSKDFVLRSVLDLFGDDSLTGEEQLSEREVLLRVGMDYDAPYSLRATVRSARENASGLRHVISTELWEAINAYYLHSQHTDAENFAQRGLYDYTMEVSRHCAVIRSRMDDTLLHDPAWMFVKLGIHLERVAQVVRIVTSKLQDIQVIAASASPNDNAVLKQYQYTVLLKIAEGFDMHRRAYRRRTTQRTVLEFLLGHPLFSRSVLYNLDKVHDLLRRLHGRRNINDPAQFRAGRLEARFRYLDHEVMGEQVETLLAETLDEVYALHHDIERAYFNPVTVANHPAQADQ